MSYRCGYVAIVGRPNVGKSTLLNKMVGEKISITSHKPQTTRHVIRGIATGDEAQIIFVDTPGLHKGARRALNKQMNRAALGTLEEVDAVILVVGALQWTAEDERVAEEVKRSAKPVVIAVNKIDAVSDKTQLLPYLAQLEAQTGWTSLVPISARTGDNCAALRATVVQLLPEGPPHFGDDEVTDRSVRFMAAEMVREKLMRRMGQELPYSVAVMIENFVENETTCEVHAVIWVERDSHKGMVIGQQGAVLKQVGTEARRDLEQLLGKKVMLHTWVKVREGWADDMQSLQTLGIADGKQSS